MQYLYEDELLVNPTTTRTKYADNKYSEITAVYDSKYGGVISSTDASGNTTDYKYDECGRIQEIRYPEYNSDNSYKYVRENYTYSRYSRFNNTEYFNVVKNTYKSSTASGYGTIVSSVSEKYDDYGNLVYRKTDVGEEEYLYDNCNRVVGYKNYDDFGTDAMSGQCSYDNLNRVETVTDALGNINHVLYKLLKKEFYFTKSGSTAKENQVKQYYDMFGNIVKTENYSRGINSNPDTNLFTYDLARNVLTATDGNGNITVFEYDNIGNNIKTILADGTIQENKFTKWGTSGKVSVKDGEKTTSVNNVYADDRGLSTSNYSTGIAIDTKPWYNSYDANGYPVKCIAPNGNERLFTYDECGNIASIQNGSQSEEIFYNFDGQISKHNKYINGRLEHSINYGYDNLERLTSKTIGSNITKYAYDNLGNLTSVTSPSGFARTYSYDRAERLVQLDFDGKTVSYDYNADGTVKKITYPNGITTEYVYDDAKRATSVTTKLGSSVKEQYSYTYDGNGNVLSVSGTKNISYTYDNLNRLKSYTENGVTTVYTYDKRNNLISEICGSNVKTYEYSGDNRLSKTIENDVETVYEYDLNGNLIRRGNDEFAYDEDNKLVYSNVNSVETTYKIGVDGLRSSKTTAGISTDYSIDEAGNVISEGSEEIIIGHMAVAKKIGSSYYYYLYNAHGDVTALTDSTGEILNNYSYDPWGRIISQTENVPNDIKYAGEYQDSETGLIYLRNRYYDPALGRFITEDPAKDGLNWYAYCGNNPINCVDPLGLESYVFYTTGKNSDFSSQAQWQKERLENMGEKVIMIPVTDVKSFENGWNGMGTVNGKSVEINYVVIYTHGNQRSMIFESGSSTKAMSIDGKNLSGRNIGNINDLQEKNIKELNLLSCNAGNLLTYYNEKGNLASVISKKVINGNTYAYDGNVSFGKPAWDILGKDIGKSSRLATNQHGFNEIAAKYHALGRKPLGKITYYNGEYKPYGYYPNTSIWSK